MGMDYVIQQASQRGIRLVLVLANYWAMYGGIDQYNIWSFQAGSGAPCGQRQYRFLGLASDQYNIWSFQAGSGAPCAQRQFSHWHVELPAPWGWAAASLAYARLPPGHGNAV